MTGTSSEGRAQPGHFYAVGIGPGAPDLLTLRAARLIESADIIVAPRCERSSESLALSCIRPFLKEQEVVEHSYPMSRDEDETRRNWAGMAGRVRDWCEDRRSVVQITIGDPLVYSTSSYLLDALEPELARARIHVIPGISAFQAAASRMGACLALQEDRLTIMPGTDIASVEAALGACETLVLYKVAKNLPELKALLARRGLLGSARLACYVEQGDKEVLMRDLESAAGTPPGYMATLLVRTGRRPWGKE